MLAVAYLEAYQVTGRSDFADVARRILGYVQSETGELMQHVEVQQVIEAPMQVVWDRYTDHVSWTDWAGLGKVRLDREGVPPPNGVGCVRVISSGGIKVFEEVVSFDPPERMTYRVVKGGIPIKDHLGEVVFEPHQRGTLVTWRCRFNSKIPGLGGCFRLLVTTLFRNALKRLSRTQF